MASSTPDGDGIVGSPAPKWAIKGGLLWLGGIVLTAIAKAVAERGTAAVSWTAADFIPWLVAGALVVGFAFRVQERWDDMERRWSKKVESQAKAASAHAQTAVRQRAAVLFGLRAQGARVITRIHESDDGYTVAEAEQAVDAWHLALYAVVGVFCGPEHNMTFDEQPPVSAKMYAPPRSKATAAEKARMMHRTNTTLARLRELSEASAAGRVPLKDLEDWPPLEEIQALMEPGARPMIQAQASAAAPPIRLAPAGRSTLIHRQSGNEDHWCQVEIYRMAQGGYEWQVEVRYQGAQAMPTGARLAGSHEALPPAVAGLQELGPLFHIVASAYGWRAFLEKALNDAVAADALEPRPSASPPPQPTP